MWPSTAIMTLGYAGILVGPAATIGFISHSTNFQTAFLILAIVLLLGVAASGRLLRV